MTMLAASLHDIHIGGGKTVALYCPNHVDYVPIVLAITMAGGKVIPINPIFVFYELENIMKSGDVDVVISRIVDNILNLLEQNKQLNKKDVPVVVIPNSRGVYQHL